MVGAFEYFFSGDLESPNFQGDNVLLALKNQAGSIIDNITGGGSSGEGWFNTGSNGGSNSDSVNNMTEQKDILGQIVLPTKEIINNTKENTVERIEHIIETITAPVKDTTNALARQLIGWLLSLLSPEEIREMLKNEFNVDICIWNMYIYIILGLFLVFILLNIFLFRRFKNQTGEFFKEIKSSFIFQVIVFTKIVSRLLKMIKRSWKLVIFSVVYRL